MTASHSGQLRDEFGEIDIYLFDQLLRGRFDTYRTVLDAGCGAGRNLVWFLRNRFEVFAVDRDEGSVLRVRQLMADLAPHLPPERVQRAEVESLPYADASMDAVLSSAVLHFARDQAHFDAMVNEMWRVLRPGGLFFARLATTIGIEDRLRPIGGERFRLPDGSTRFLMDEARLLERTSALGATLADPVRTTNVQNLRAMTTWCLIRPARQTDHDAHTMMTETRLEAGYAVPRRFIRHTADVPLEVERTGGGAGLTPSATNVSFGGLSFVSDEELPEGTEIRVRITQVHPPFDAEARVVWCKAEGDAFCIGVQFLGKEDAFRIRMVEQVCAIDQYRRESAEQGRQLTPEEAATEWITRFADRFPSS